MVTVVNEMKTKFINNGHRRPHSQRKEQADIIMTIDNSNIQQLYRRGRQGRFGLLINPNYDVLFGLMKSHEELSSYNEDDGSNEEEDVLGGSLEDESLHTSDFSTSTSTELKTTSTSSPSDGLKTSSGSTENENETNHSEEGEALHPAPYTATETLDEESKTTSDNRKPPSKSDEEEKAQTSPRSEHFIHSELNQANQNHESFPYTLRRMLNIETELADQQSIKWLAAGDGFEVIDQNDLEKTVLPKYFPSSCLFQSFIRKLYRQVKEF